MDISELGFGLFGTYLIANEIKCFGDLPEFSKDYKLYDVNSEEDVEKVLEVLKRKNKNIDEKYKEEINSSIISFELNDYELECFLTALLFTNVFDYWVGFIKPENYLLYDNDLALEYDLLEMVFWDYLKSEYDLYYLKNKTKDFCKKYLIKAGI